MKTTYLFRTAVCYLALASYALAQSSAASDAESVAKSRTEAYVAAFNSGDAGALAALYAEDAQYTNDEGTSLVGRAAVLESLKNFFRTGKGAKLIVQMESARFLTPDVLVEKGLATIGDETTRYVSNYVKKDGAWLISELNETALPPVDAASVALNDLGWLVGTWKDNSPGVTVATSVDWTKNRHFLRRSVSITRDGEEAMEATEVIGYDPVAGAVRSWVFDSDGGFGEGRWTREADKWLISFTATAPDGATSSAQHVITFVDAKKYTWESINRQSGGQVLPNLDKVEVVRTGGE